MVDKWGDLIAKPGMQGRPFSGERDGEKGPAGLRKHPCQRL